MNVSQPVASYIGSVNFGVISSEEIRRMSAKRIQNPETFDTLLHPTPGGLYDLALGAWSDYTCSTCELKVFACPGHPGHIDLPVPIYHSIWMDQLVHLLQAQCPYCFRFRIAATMKNGLMCKLQLLQYGLVADAQHIDRLEVRERARDDSTDAEQDADERNEELIKKQNRFVKRCITKAGLRRDASGMVKSKTETVLQARRLVLAEVMSALGRPTKCASCEERPFKWRKDKFNKIFRDTATNSRRKDQPRKKHANPFLLETEAAKVGSQEKKPDDVIDEAIELELDDQDQSIADPDGGLIIDGAADTTSLEKESAPALQGRKNEYVQPTEVRAYIRSLFSKEQQFLDLIYSTDHIDSAKGAISPNIFFIDTLLVPPNKYRPDAKTGEGQITEAQQNTLYKNILKSCIALHQLQMELSGEVEPMYRRRDFTDFQTLWVGLQDNVNALFDSERSTAPRRGNREPEEGIKQRLEKKEGLFRMNMMGKRVNFAARSVISPDPNIETNEIGVPPVFAKKLTFPEPVTNHNFDELKEAVMNGQEQWPGATAIENENGQVISLLRKSPEERQALANQLLAPSSTSVTGSRNKKVHRHLRNGDILIMNRQPTLHKPSMMCHRARVLPGEKTIRMHYANCNTYNADFDGDEMNMHFPQSFIARAEAYEIADTDHQYLVATSGKPLRGLIQDHLSMGVWLTNRDTFFNRSDYYQLLYSSLRPENGHTATERILTVPPAILKPRALWTGKQVITTVLKNVKPAEYKGLTMVGKEGKTALGWSSESEERFLLLQDGELLMGILDKGHLGPTDGGFVHSIYEAYGHKTAGRLLSVIGRLLTKFLHMRAWSCGIADIVLSPQGDQTRKDHLQEADNIGIKVATKYVSLEDVSSSDDPELRARLADVLRDTEKHAGLDGVYATQNADLSSIVSKAILPQGLWRPFPWNQMQTMTISGAKGSIVNANQISCNLGQQVLEGRRVPVMVSGKTLPSFKPYEIHVRAGGFVANRFLTGVQPQEYYFHAMAGREGLIDTAVKTARSGYLQRCIIKGMEGLKVEYDTSVRDTDGSVIQFLYGEDGLDVTKMKHLTDFKFLAENITSMASNMNLQQGYHRLFNETALLWNKKALKKLRKGDAASMDPATAHFNPGSHWGSTSEAFAQALKDYIENNPDNLIKSKKTASTSGLVSKKNFETLVQMKYLKSVVDPGEAVGIVAGQSIGEPSTQMTLNTFHLAGHAAKNVTLGIPRLREIVMTASKHIMTPTMTLRLASGIDEEMAQQFAKGITRLSFAETVESVQVREMVTKGQHYQQARIYRVVLNMYPQDELQREYAITTRDVQVCVEHSFLPKLIASIKKDLKAKWKADAKNPNSALPDVGKASANVGGMAEHAAEPEVDPETAEKAANDGGDDDSDADVQPDDDATQAKMKKGAVDNYDDSEDDMEAEEQSAAGDDGAKEPEEPEDEGYVGSPQTQAADAASKSTAAAPTEYEQAVLARYNDLSGFTFDIAASRVELQIEHDVNTAKVLVLNHVESACRAALVQFIEGVGACTLSSEKVKQAGSKKALDMPVVITQGCNLLAMRDYQDYIDPHRMETNDISAMLEFYGVEAARGTIIREMSGVFEGHSIQVDNRHLNLIADMMTRHGGFAPFNRYGMKSSTSPFMKMSFETTVGFLKDAVLAAERDDLLNPSARLVVGKTSGVGTGAFDVLLPLTQESGEIDKDEELGDADRDGDVDADADEDMDEEL